YRHSERQLLVIRGSRSSHRGRCSGGLSGLRGLLRSRGSRAHLPVNLHNRLTVDVLGGAANPTLHLHTQSVAGLEFSSLKVLTKTPVRPNQDPARVDSAQQHRPVLAEPAILSGTEPTNRTFTSKVAVVPQNFALNTRGLAVATVARVDRSPRHYVFSFLLRLIDENGLALVRVGIRNGCAFPHVL